MITSDYQPDLPVDFVQKSLMPKGVDHPSIPIVPLYAVPVQKSLMPKGVDHWLEQMSGWLKLLSAKIFDAERR